MVLCSVDSKICLVNALANFIVDTLGKDVSSIIKIVDVGNFLVVKGKTSRKEELKLSDVISEFTNNYKNHFESLKISNTIDLIEYNCKMDKREKLSLTLYNTEKSDFHYTQIDYFKENGKTNDFDSVIVTENINDLVTTSFFPHGYSFDQGKGLYFFIKKIFYKIPSNYPFTKLIISVDTKEKYENHVKVFNCFTECEDEIIQSSILDGLKFSLTEVESEMKKADINYDLLSPIEEHDYLTEGYKFVIL